MMSDLLRPASLLVAVLLSGCGHPMPWNTRFDPALATLVPADTNVLVELNLARLRGTPVYQQHLAPMAAHELGDITRLTGIDPNRDVDQVLLASNGRNFVTLVRGRFNPADAASRMQANGASRTSDAGIAVFEQDGNAIAFADSSMAVAGSDAAVRDALERRKNGGGGIPAELKSVVDEVPSNDQIWAAVVGGAPAFPAEGNLRNLAELARLVNRAFAGLDVQNGLNLQARADCGSEEDARRVHDALRGFVALARMSAPANRPELIHVFDAINIVREQTRVRLTASLDQKELDAFLGLWSKP